MTGYNLLMQTKFEDFEDFELITDDAEENAEEVSILTELVNVDPGYYIIFSKASGEIYSIARSPNVIIGLQMKELFINESDELDQLFSNQLNFENIKVKYDIDKKHYSLVSSKDYSSIIDREFVLVDTNIKNDRNVFDIIFNVTNKKVFFKLNYDQLNYYLSTQTPEYVLELTNSEIIFYIFDNLDPTLLWERFEINLKQLMDQEFLCFDAAWCDIMRTGHYKILTSNIGVDYTVSIDDRYVRDHLDYETSFQKDENFESASFALTVHNDNLVITSYMDNPKNYKISENINLYIHAEHEPEYLLRTYTINRRDLADKKEFVLGKNEFNTRISAVTDHRHINVETIYE